MSTDSQARTVRLNTGNHNTETSDTASVHEEEYTTALPVFSSQAPKELKDKEKRERGLRGVLPFQRKKKDKDREKEKDRDKSKHKEKDKEREKEKGMLDLLEKERRGEHSVGSMRSRPDKEKRKDDRDEEF